MKFYKHIILGCWIALIASFFISCEKEIDFNVTNPKDAIVVEGHIENGLPPYVMLTKNSAFFDDINLNDLGAYFINGATITVSTDDDSVKLVEYNSTFLKMLPDSQVIALAAQFGISIDSVNEFPDISIYTIAPTDSSFIGIVGKHYDLRIEVDGKVITATTTIPTPVFFDSLWTLPHPNPILADSFFQLYGQLHDPPTEKNYYRYFTKSNNGAFLISDQTVFDDAFFNGKDFKIFIPKGHPMGFPGTRDFEKAGYWDLKDSICTIKLSQIDKAHYDFWRTLEANRQNQGNPFSSVVYVKSNVNGANGIWGGYGSITGSYVRTTP